ncbi:baseplate J/gp47 family protein [Lacticaseibacillus pabuli]|uniref:Baseplate J/gp47 family protein n=1 Tax=Lacticaseibacillus pabuli TaxID=3025672 RepID=A0ABY7WU00_9LACO|nr:baseplate J/gp47 family protein [Lacticaseibacillus sp. KACC 23028]WDF83643.1 baseplate J/gp47 family protein [Lacticaseibacillus sp. KACC 23028]
MTPQEYASQFSKYTFDYFINSALNNVPDTIDKREGSIIYDAIAPVALDYEALAIELQNALLMSFTQTATDEFLDYRGQEKGLTRKPATYAQVTATMTDTAGAPAVVQVGDRFSSEGADPFIYDVVTPDDDGKVVLQCEQLGTAPNHYVGNLLPVTAQSLFGTGTITDVSVPARDAESDDDFRARILGTTDALAYGGNIADYQQMVDSLQVTGAVQVYPTWDGGGTVKLVIIDNDYDLPSEELINQVQQAIMPTDDAAVGNGYGLAPIGHTVTVVAPNIRTIPVSFTLTVDGTTDYDTAMASAKQALADYFLDRRKVWGTLAKGSRQYALSLYRSQIMSTIMAVPGVVNVTKLLLDGADADVQMQYTRLKSELPELGEVSISENPANQA